MYSFFSFACFTRFFDFTLLLLVRLLRKRARLHTGLPVYEKCSSAHTRGIDAQRQTHTVAEKRTKQAKTKKKNDKKFTANWQTCTNSNSLRLARLISMHTVRLASLITAAGCYRMYGLCVRLACGTNQIDQSNLCNIFINTWISRIERTICTWLTTNIHIYINTNISYIKLISTGEFSHWMRFTLTHAQSSKRQRRLAMDIGAINRNGE